MFTALPAPGVIFAYLRFRQPIDMAAEARSRGQHVWAQRTALPPEAVRSRIANVLAQREGE